MPWDRPAARAGNGTGRGALGRMPASLASEAKTCFEEADQKAKERQCLMVLFFLCFLVRAVMACCAHPVSYVSDEVSAISAAAIAAGHPWKDVVSQAGYYGFGFLILFAPLFRLGLGARTIYRIMLVLLAAVDAAGAVMCYLIQSRFFGGLSRSFRFWTSLLCFSLLFFSLPDINVRNENILLLLSWLLMYCLCLMVRGEHRMRAQIGATVLLAYAQTVHTRSVVLVVGFTAVCVLYLLLYRKLLVDPPFLLLTVVGAVAGKAVASAYIRSIWAGGSARNTSVSGVLARSAGKAKLSLTYIGCILRIGFGQLFTASSVSLGLFLLSAAAIVIFVLRKRPLRKDGEEDRLLLVTGTMYLFNIVLTIGAQSISWSNGVYNGVVAGTYTYSYKAFTYLRYFGFNVPPMILTGILVCALHREIFRKAVPVYAAAAIVLTVIWLLTIVPLISTESNYYYKLIPLWKRGYIPTAAEWAATAVIMLLLMGGTAFLLLKKKWRVVCMVALVYLIAGFSYQFFSSTIKSQKKFEKMSNATCRFLEYVRSEVPVDEVYVHDGRGVSDHQNFYIAQFLNYDCHVLPGLPEDPHDGNDYLVISNRNVQGYFETDYWWVRLDKNEYAFFTDEAIADMVREDGGTVHSVRPATVKKLYMFYNKESGDHFYTVNTDEIDALCAPGSAYRFAGTRWDVVSNLTPDTTPVYRFFDQVDKNHIYVVSEEERAFYKSDSARYHSEGVAWYAAKTGAPVYCIYDADKKDCYYTDSEAEKDRLLEDKPACSLLETGMYARVGEE